MRDKEGALLSRLKLTERISNQGVAYAKATKPEAWQDVNTYRWARADHERLLREQRTFQKRVASYSIKFDDQRFLNIADYHYIMASDQLIPRLGLPVQWGLLDEISGVCVPASLKTMRKNTGIVCNILRAIARNNTTESMRARGVSFTEEDAIFLHAGHEVQNKAL